LMLCAFEFDLAPAREIVVARPIEPRMERLLWEEFDPNRTLLNASAEIAQYQPNVAAMSGPAVYVCENFACQAPAKTAEDLAPLLK
ncbi:MAG: hypothetical protein QOJ99_4234, partial [Bryobacterales bacterium]|nr:hypothetical protein [Bryobacterales bacterium]